MNRLAVSLVLVTVSTLAACTNNADKPSQNASSALDSIQNPTGTFDANNAGSAFGHYDTNKNASSGLGSATGGSDGSSSTQSHHLRILAGQVQQSGCSEGSSCACPSGGTFTYSRQSTDYGPAIQATFDSCVFSDGSGFNGDMVLLASDRPLLKSDKAAAIQGDQAGGKSLLLAAEGTFVTQQQKFDASVVFLAEAGVDYLAVEVQDGKVVIGVRESDGLAVVYAKDTTWICKPGSDSEYSCEEQSSGQKLTASKNGDSSSTPPAPSSSSSGSSSSSPPPRKG